MVDDEKVQTKKKIGIKKIMKKMKTHACDSRISVPTEQELSLSKQLAATGDKCRDM